MDVRTITIIREEIKMANRHNISETVRGFKRLLKEIKDGDRAYFYLDFDAGFANERELIAALKKEAEAKGVAFEVEYDDGVLVIWAGAPEYMSAGGFDD